MNLPLNTQRSHSRSQRAGKWSLILAHDRRPIYRAPTYIVVPLLGPHQPRYIGLTLFIVSLELAILSALNFLYCQPWTFIASLEFLHCQPWISILSALNFLYCQPWTCYIVSLELAILSALNFHWKPWISILSALDCYIVSREHPILSALNFLYCQPWTFYIVSLELSILSALNFHCKPWISILSALNFYIVSREHPIL